MRTPGDDIDLCYGFMLSEGIIDSFNQVESVKETESSGYTVIAKLKPDVQFDTETLLRHFYTSSSCGICGKVSIAAVKVHVRTHSPSNFSISSSNLNLLPRKLVEKQQEFQQTGGLHASALFDHKGEICRVREDIGRHNALDKLVGSWHHRGLDSMRNLGLVLSGRANFELIQKAAIAGVPLVASIGPPSSLAIDLAKEQDMTLIGFLKQNSFNVYHGERVIHD